MEPSIQLEARYYRLYPPENPLGYEHETFTLPMSQTAFLVCDVYCSLGLSPDDPIDNSPEDMKKHYAAAMTLPKNEAKKVMVSNIKPALDAARLVDMAIVYISNSGPKGAIENSEFAKTHNRMTNTHLKDLFAEDNVDPREYTYGHSAYLKITNLLKPLPNEYFIRKHVYSGFFNTRLDTVLRNLGIHNLICVGFSADICLHGTMIDALYLNYKVILLRDCTLAVELPGEVENLTQTKRIITWTECFIGYTSTSTQFCEACIQYKKINQ